MAGIDSLQSLFEDELKDIYDAEKQITKALPKMIKKAGAQELKAAFEEHLQQTQQHIERLEQVFELLEMPARGKKCVGMLRHGAHHANRPSFSGSSVRPTSTRPRPMIRSSMARSSGS